MTEEDFHHIEQAYDVRNPLYISPPNPHTSL